MPDSRFVGLPTYRDLLNDAAQQLSNASDSPRIDAEVLMQNVIERPLAWLLAYGDTFATADHLKTFTRLIEQRQSGMPVAYLVGYKEFWSLKLKVNEAVLVPRPDTETLVEAALDALRGKDAPTVLDLGTGSGAIALAIAKERPDAQVVATDISSDALVVARSNARLNQINNVRFVESNWYQQLDKTRFDLIAANPPYLAPDDHHLGKGDLRFEPQLALSAEDDGFADLAGIIAGATDYLAPAGALILEHGFTQAEGVKAILEQHGFSNICLYHDLNKLPRCTLGGLPL